MLVNGNKNISKFTPFEEQPLRVQLSGRQTRYLPDFIMIKVLKPLVDNIVKGEYQRGSTGSGWRKKKEE